MKSITLIKRRTIVSPIRFRSRWHRLAAEYVLVSKVVPYLVEKISCAILRFIRAELLPLH